MSKEYSLHCQQLEFNDSLSEEEVAEKIANQLQEENKELIYKIVKAVGVKQATLIYNETVRIEGNGGMRREDGAGRKTPGGVFFYVIHHNSDVLNEELKRIFSEESHRKEKLRRMQVKVERRKKAELLKEKFIREGLLSNCTSNDND